MCIVSTEPSGGMQPLCGTEDWTGNTLHIRLLSIPHIGWDHGPRQK